VRLLLDEHLPPEIARRLRVKDLVPLAHRAAVDGEDHYGLVLTSDRWLSAPSR
jgi:hypothetical protein